MAAPLTRYHDFISYVLLSAPDDFPAEDYLSADEQMTLEKAFVELQSALPVVVPKFSSDCLPLLRTMLEMSLEAYQCGDPIRGAHILQEFEGLIWPSRVLPERFAIEAKNRLSR
ncbi:hypothetical protein P350_07915 [Burkholderia cepacia JBK9]|uniref:hypothetical protein n=1 Tax=Burkholderia arboris TaxID=488730 RepID=UPI0004D4B6B8|nr:hypothetical protein [Burkholderia arboris]ALX11477.1 hypothetical protein P350_07915 [Burkholderia cepacia JBK9]MCA8491214.1 hypothetical protein [Burkholderia arboris]